MNNYIDSDSLEFIPAQYKSGDVESAGLAYAYGVMMATNQFFLVFEAKKRFKKNNIYPFITVDSLYGQLVGVGGQEFSPVDYKATATLTPVVFNEHQIGITVETTGAISGAVANTPVVFAAVQFGFTVQ